MARAIYKVIEHGKVTCRGGCSRPELPIGTTACSGTSGGWRLQAQCLEAGRLRVEVAPVGVASAEVLCHLQAWRPPKGSGSRSLPRATTRGG
ncbi:hypothetical protein B296_00047548 [Ensete ventricosum]|uniref:Uncharacterized protein n=1 Tax=Ensete ventricosum TaxID=4639 RepID=A0A426WZ73_ENSVE|nr:hypothetical protein B296_00047548 [Ensete ventricosum]